MAERGGPGADPEESRQDGRALPGGACVFNKKKKLYTTALNKLNLGKMKMNISVHIVLQKQPGSK